MVKKKNDTVKQMFDESTGTDSEKENDEFLSPTTQSESGFQSPSASNQPLASSSRRSLRRSPIKSHRSRTVSAQRLTTSPQRQRIALRSQSQHKTPNDKNVTTRPSSTPRTTRTEMQNRSTDRSLQMSKNVAPTRTRASTSKRKQKQPKKKLVLDEIRKYQKSVDHLIPKLPFSKLIREVLSQYSDRHMRITPVALQAIQESAEIYLTIFFEDAYRCTLHRGRVTLIVKDMELVRVLRGVNDPGYKIFE